MIELLGGVLAVVAVLFGGFYIAAGIVSWFYRRWGS